MSRPLSGIKSRIGKLINRFSVINKQTEVSRQKVFDLFLERRTMCPTRRR
ncbi:MAG: hypothetical protein ACI9RZ_002330, partial [Sphingobacteriales bacterium]